MTMKRNAIGTSAAIGLAALTLAALPAAAQDAAAGEKVFKKCAACHAIGPGAKNKTGPELNGVIGRAAGSISEFKYSDAMAGSGLTCDAATLARFLAAPKEVVKGTKMTFAGLKKESEISDVIAYLDTFNADGSTK